MLWRKITPLLSFAHQKKSNPPLVLYAVAQPKLCYMGTNNTSPWPPGAGCDCCFPEKVVQVPTCSLFLFPCSKPVVFLYPEKEGPSVAGFCSLQLEGEDGGAQDCGTDPDPSVFHTCREKVLGVGSKQPLRYCYCS